MYGIAGAVIGVAYVLRAIGDVGNAGAELALADRLVPGDARVLRPALVAGAAAARRARPSVRRRRTRSSPGATSAPACSPPGRAGAAGAGPAAAGSGWPGGCSAARSSAGRSGCSSPGSPTARSATTSATWSATRDLAGDVRCRAAATSSTGSTRPSIADARADRVRLRDLLGAAAARRGGGRTPRGAARDRAARARAGWLGHVAVTVAGIGGRAGRRRSRASAPATRWSPATATRCVGCRPGRSCRTLAPVLVLSGGGPAAVRRRAAGCWCWPGCRWCFAVGGDAVR